MRLSLGHPIGRAVIVGAMALGFAPSIKASALGTTKSKKLVVNP